MAKDNKDGSISYEQDAFDNPPKGPAGVHRGARSVAARVTPFIVVVLVAALCGFVAWGAFSGEFGKIRMPWSSSSTTAASAASGTDSSSEKTSSSDSPAAGSGADGSQDSDDGTNGDASQSGDGQDSQDAQSADQQQTGQQDVQQTQQPAQPDKTKGVSVVNGTSITGYAASKQSALAAAGYTNVSSSNPNGMSLPASTVVWYASQDDQATAQDVANALGISSVQQVDGLGTPVVVVLMS